MGVVWEQGSPVLLDRLSHSWARQAVAWSPARTEGRSRAQTQILFCCLLAGWRYLKRGVGTGPVLPQICNGWTIVLSQGYR